MDIKVHNTTTFARDQANLLGGDSKKKPMAHAMGYNLSFLRNSENCNQNLFNSPFSNAFNASSTVLSSLQR